MATHKLRDVFHKRGSQPVFTIGVEDSVDNAPAEYLLAEALYGIIYMLKEKKLQPQEVKKITIRENFRGFRFFVRVYDE